MVEINNEERKAVTRMKSWVSRSLSTAPDHSADLDLNVSEEICSLAYVVLKFFAVFVLIHIFSVKGLEKRQTP
jgi:hypothetical protein